MFAKLTASQFLWLESSLIALFVILAYIAFVIIFMILCEKIERRQEGELPKYTRNCNKRKCVVCNEKRPLLATEQ